MDEHNYDCGYGSELGIPVNMKFIGWVIGTAAILSVVGTVYLSQKRYPTLLEPSEVVFYKDRKYGFLVTTTPECNTYFYMHRFDHKNDQGDVSIAKYAIYARSTRNNGPGYIEYILTSPEQYNHILNLRMNTGGIGKLWVVLALKNNLLLATDARPKNKFLVSPDESPPRSHFILNTYYQPKLNDDLSNCEFNVKVHDENQ